MNDFNNNIKVNKMKKSVLLFIVMAMLLGACERHDESNGMYCFGAGYIKYKATIGYDFESAFDSLQKVVHFDQLHQNESYYIEPELLNRVEYPSNDREFYMISVKDSTNNTYLSSPSNVLDTKGDWYKIIWGED